MKKFRAALCVSAMAIAAGILSPPVSASEPDNQKLVEKAMNDLFVKRDLSAISRYWIGDAYIQHNPQIANGTKALRELVESLPKAFRYEPGAMVAQGDFVMMHGRYIGFAAQPMIAVDIFRIVNGKIAEHWDVMQAEVPADKTANGNPMFVPGQ